MCSSTTGTFPPNFARIRLNRAREADYPDGSREHGYRLVVPLGADGRIDPTAWKANRERCRVVHFGPGKEIDVGHLVRRPGGSWAFHYDLKGDEGDSAGYRFQHERFVPGEYVSIREETGIGTYVVAAVKKTVGSRIKPRFLALRFSN